MLVRLIVRRMIFLVFVLFGSTVYSEIFPRVAELKDAKSRLTALVGAAIALALVPLTPPGVPILAAASAALIGLTRYGDPR